MRLAPSARPFTRAVDSGGRATHIGDVDQGGETVWYFAYGSNLHDAIFRERRGMRARAVRRGWLDGFRLCFNLPVGPGERGVANIEATVGESICGALYLLTPSDCDRLDRTVVGSRERRGGDLRENRRVISA